MAPTQRPRRSSAFRLWATSLAIVAALGVAARADAQTTNEGERPAAAIFDEGRAAFAKKDYATAARKFEEANLRAPRGQTNYNAAISWEAAGDTARASDAFASALEDKALPAAAREHARERLAALERITLTLHVAASGTANATIAHVVDRPLPATVHVTPGRHELVVRFLDGSVVRQEIEARAGERVTFKVSPPALADARPAPAPAAVDALPGPLPAPSSPTQDAQPPSPDAPRGDAELRPSIQPMLGWIALGAGAVSLGAATYLGLRGIDARDRFDDSGGTDADARSSAIALRTWANVGWVAAGAFVATGVVLLVTAKRSFSKGPRAGISLVPCAVRGSF